MEDQRLQLSPTNLPDKFKPKYVIKRIDEADIIISLEARDAILVQLDKGARFILIKDHILMLNSIKSIDPLWGEKNIPPRPKAVYMFNGAKVDYPMYDDKAENQEDIDEWDKYFGAV